MLKKKILNRQTKKIKKKNKTYTRYNVYKAFLVKRLMASKRKLTWPLAISKPTEFMTLK